jgi:hypothetical protein
MQCARRSIAGAAELAPISPVRSLAGLKNREMAMSRSAFGALARKFSL